MKAIIKTGGKQYSVTVGDIIYVEKLDLEVNKKVTFNDVLMVNDSVGNPIVAGASVIGKVISHGKQRKIKIFTYTNKTKSSRRTKGHRQPYTKVEITEING